MFRFTIRDLIWLTVVVAVGGGGWANRRAILASREDLVVKADRLTVRNERLQKGIEFLEEQAGLSYLLIVENYCNKRFACDGTADFAASADEYCSIRAIRVIRGRFLVAAVRPRWVLRVFLRSAGRFLNSPGNRPVDGR